jgi:hypothetical protein
VRLIFKKRIWGQWLLAGGLLLILVQGVILLPEVSLRFRRDRFCQEQIAEIQKELGYEGISLDRNRATADALERAMKSGFPSFPPGPRPTNRGLQQALARSQATYREKEEQVLQLQFMLQRFERLRDQFRGLNSNSVK